MNGKLCTPPFVASVLVAFILLLVLAIPEAPKTGAGEIIEKVDTSLLTKTRLSDYTYELKDSNGASFSIDKVKNKIDKNKNILLDCDILTCDYKVEITAKQAQTFTTDTLKGGVIGAGASVQKIFYQDTHLVEKTRFLYKMVKEERCSKNTTKDGAENTTTCVIVDSEVFDREETYNVTEPYENTDLLKAFAKDEVRTYVIRFAKDKPYRNVDIYHTFYGQDRKDGAWWNASYPYKYQITFYYNQTVATNQSNLIGYVSMNTSNSVFFNLTTGTNIRFLNADENVSLAYILMSTNSTFLGNSTNNATYAVIINMSNSTNTTIYAYVGAVNSTAGNDSARFCALANLTAFWTLGEGAGSTMNEICNGYNGIKNANLRFNVSGKHGFGLFGVPNNQQDYMNFSAITIGNTYTLYAYANKVGADSYRTLWGNPSPSAYHFLVWTPTGYLSTANGQSSSGFAEQNLANNTLHQMVLSCNAGTGTFYVNGTAVGSTVTCRSEAVKGFMGFGLNQQWDALTSDPAVFKIGKSGDYIKGLYSLNSIVGAIQGGNILTSSGISFTNSTSGSWFYANASATSTNGNITSVNATTTSGSCVQFSNSSTSPDNISVAYNCSGTGLVSTTVNITFADSNNMTASSVGTNTYPQSIQIITSSILPSPAYTNASLTGWCNATDSPTGNLTYNYTWYLNGVANESGSFPPVQNIVGTGGTKTTTVINGTNYTLHYFNYTGTNQSFNMTVGANITVMLWGAGGGTGTASAWTLGFEGGGGGYTEANITTNQTSYTIQVGQGGVRGTTPGTFNAFGGGGTYCSAGVGCDYAGAGGGRSSFGNSTVEFLIAGAGGGGGVTRVSDGQEGGGGGGASGQDGISTTMDCRGRGGNQTSGGLGGSVGAGNGSLYKGGSGHLYTYGASGGGGYYGGGGGGYLEPNDMGGGGGGSGYAPIGVTVAADYQTPANNLSIYRNGAGEGGEFGENGTAGLVVIRYLTASGGEQVSSGVLTNVANISNSSLVVGQNWTLQCLAYNSNVSSSVLNSSVTTISTPIIILSSRISPTPYVNYTQTLLGYCNATSSLNFTLNGTWFQNGVQVSSFLVNNISPEAEVNVANLTVNMPSGYDGGQNYTFRCIANNSIGASPAVNSTYTNTTRAIIFMNQTPADIDTLNVVNTPLRIQYNLTSNGWGASNTSALFFIKTNSTTSNIFEYTNGTAESGYFNYTVTSTLGNLVNFTVEDNEIYPHTENMDDEDFRVVTQNATALTGANQYYATSYLNVSNESQYGFYEQMFNSTTASVVRTYVCNSSFAFTNSPAGNANCAQIGSTVANAGYAHCHGVNNASCHQVINFDVNTTSGTISGIKVTSNMTFIIRGNSGATINFYGISKITRIGATRLSTNNGAAWTNQTFTTDGHLHQYNNHSIWYYACANATYGCSDARQDLIGLAGLPPTPPFIITPTNSTYDNSINISYQQSTSPNAYQIVKYNITLRNIDSSFNLTILENNSPNLSYLYNTTSLANGQYIIRVMAYDNLSQTSFDESGVFTIYHVIGLNLSIWNGSSWIPYNSTVSMNVRCNITIGSSAVIFCQPKNQNNETNQPILMNTNNGTTVSTWQAIRSNTTFGVADFKCGVSNAYPPAINLTTVLTNYSTTNLSAAANNSLYCWLRIPNATVNLTTIPRTYYINITNG